MFIKSIVKTNVVTKKMYEYLRLCESYRIGDKTRHKAIVSMGLVPYLDTKEKKKALADRIETLLTGNLAFDFDAFDSELEALAQLYYNKIISKKTIANQLVIKIDHEVDSNFQNIDLETVTSEKVRDIGSEWLCYQALEQLGFSKFLEQQGWEKKWIQYAMIHLICKAVYPCSENKTAYWIQNNSDVASLLGVESQKITRHHLYEVCRKLYEIKTDIETFLSHKTNELFDIQDTICFYDLTNSYFEGRKENSELAQFGRSKEKRNDAKLVSLALVANAEGFVKYSKIYKGNISEPGTLLETVKALSTATCEIERKPFIVMDASFSTVENLTMLKDNGFDYLCVTRSKLKNYKVLNPDKPKVELQDNRGNKINVEFITKEKSKKLADRVNDHDTFLYIKSNKKAVKEASMEAKYSIKFEEEIQNLVDGLSKPKGTKTLQKVSERIGKIKERYSYANKFYELEIIEKDGIVSNIICKKKTIETKTTDGVYFIRTSKKELQEIDIWKIYNTLTEIEATFRILKTDLAIRPVHHQTDQNTEPHIFMGVLAYQMVATIRHQLKSNQINDSWQTILMKTNSQKSVITSMLNDKNKKIIVKNCNQPSTDAKAIFKALNYKNQPYVKNNIVLSEK